MADNNSNDRNISNRNNSKSRKIESLQLKRLIKQEKENRELRKQMTTLLNYQRELEKRLNISADANEEIRKNNASIDKILKENQKYEKALQSAQEKMDEEQSDFYRIALQDNNIELNRLKELNQELKKGNKANDENLEDVLDSMEDLGDNFADNVQSLIDSFNIMAIKDSMDEGIAEISSSMIDITNALHLNEDEASAFKDTLSDNLKQFNKLNNNMLNASDMQEAVAKLIEAGVTDTSSLIEYWESIAVADKLGYDIGSQQGIMQYVDSEADIQAITGALVKTQGLDGVDQDAILQAVNTIMPSIAHLSDSEQHAILNEAISAMATAQSVGIEGFEDLYADMVTDMYNYNPSKGAEYAEKYGANTQLIQSGDITSLTRGLFGQVGMAKFDKSMLESYGWSDEMIESANKTNANGEALLTQAGQLASEDSMKALETAQEDYHTSVIDSLKNKISPYLMTISNEVSSWGLDWSDISGLFLAGKGIWDIIKGISKFLGIGSLGANTSVAKTAADGASTVTKGGKLTSLGKSVWTGIKGIGSTIAGTVGGTASAVALAVPAVLGYLGFKDAKAQQDAWNKKSKREQDAELKDKVIQYMKEEEVIQDQSKSKSQFDVYGMHRNGLDYVPIDGYKAILHSGEMVLNRKDADLYRNNLEPNYSKHSHRNGLESVPYNNYAATLHSGEIVLSASDAEVIRKNNESLARNESNAQITLGVLDQLKSHEVLGRARETALEVFHRAKSPTSTSTDVSTGGSFNSTGSYVKDTWSYLTSKGYSKQATAGIMGNLYQESGLNPTAIQGNGRGPAAGIAQWENYNTKSARWKKMSDYAKSLGKPWTDLQAQLDWIDLEMQGKDPTTLQHLKRKVGGYDAFKALNDIRKATLIFEESFERAGKPNMSRRYAAAENYYNDLAKYEQGTPYVPTDQVALLHKGEMIVPKEYNPINSGITLPMDTDLTELMQLLKWGFEYIGKKLDEEKIVTQPTTNKNFRTLNEVYQNKKISR